MTRHQHFSISGTFQKDYFGKDFAKYTSSFLHETSKSESLSEYILIFESIFQVEDMFQAFYLHLHHEHCAENMDFLVEFEQFLKENQKTVSIKKLKELVDKYMVRGGEAELNLSHQTKEALLNILKEQLTLEEWKLKETPQEVFYNVRNAVLLEMKMGTFPRFVRKNLCQLVVLKLNFDPKVVYLQKNAEYPYKDEGKSIFFIFRFCFSSYNR